MYFLELGSERVKVPPTFPVTIPELSAIGDPDSSFVVFYVASCGLLRMH